MKNLPISVIITTYNDTGYLAFAIESVLNQIIPPKEIIIVDDGSDSYMAKIIAYRYLDNKSNVEVSYYRKKNGGASSARNLGLSHVSQPYVTFLDADDQYLESNLINKYEILSELGPHYFGVYGSALTTEGLNQDFINFDGNPPTSYVGKFQTGIPGGCCYYLFRTKLIRAIGPFDEGLTNNEDFDFIIRLLKEGFFCRGSAGYTNLISIRHNSLSRNRDYVKTFNAMSMFLDKAEKEKYFSHDELRRRRKNSHLFLTKRLISKKPTLAIKHLLLAANYKFL